MSQRNQHGVAKRAFGLTKEKDTALGVAQRESVRFLSCNAGFSTARSSMQQNNRRLISQYLKLPVVGFKTAYRSDMRFPYSGHSSGLNPT